MKPINYLDGFSGYGGFHLALKQSGYEFNKCYFSEIDKYAIANYRYNFPESIYAGSITDIPKNGIITEGLDLFTFGWPCQDNSIAGKRKGQQPGTRSGLLYSAVEIISKYKPRIFIAENVEGLRSVNKGIDIIESLKILSLLSEGCPQYDIEMQLLNTSWFLPQNRERLYFVGHLRASGGQKVFPIGENDSRLNEGTSETTSVRCITAGGHLGGMHSSMTLISGTIRPFKDGKGFREMKSGLSPTLCTRSRTDGSGMPVIINRPHGFFKGSETSISPTLNSQSSKDNLYVKADSYSRLTPLEFERLQGLPDEWCKYGLFGALVKQISDTQRYKLCGNGVSIPVVKTITDKLKVNFL